MTRVSAGIERYSIESRALLDLIAFEVSRIGLPSGSTISTASASPLLVDDLGNRLGNHELLDVSRRSEAPVFVCLLDTDHLWDHLERHAYEGVIVAFRNSTSYKRLLYRNYAGESFHRVEARIGGAYHIVASWGIMAPAAIAALLLSGAARHLGRHGLADQLADRGTLSPIHRGQGRRLCSIGVVVGNRR